MATQKRQGVETLGYQMVQSFEDFEIRKYEAFLIVSIDTSKMLGSTGFSSLYKYISGENTEKREIPMTAPVLNKVSQKHGAMAFVMPKDMSLESIPVPLKEDMSIKEMNAGFYAVLRFNGFNNKAKIKYKIKIFKELIKENNYKILSEFYLARFDPPFTLPPLRKNELLVEVSLEES